MEERLKRDCVKRDSRNGEEGKRIKKLENVDKVV